MTQNLLDTRRHYQHTSHPKGKKFPPGSGEIFQRLLFTFYQAFPWRSNSHSFSRIYRSYRTEIRALVLHSVFSTTKQSVLLDSPFVVSTTTQLRRVRMRAYCCWQPATATSADSSFPGATTGWFSNWLTISRGTPRSKISRSRNWRTETADVGFRYDNSTFQQPPPLFSTTSEVGPGLGTTQSNPLPTQTKLRCYFLILLFTPIITT